MKRKKGGSPEPLLPRRKVEPIYAPVTVPWGMTWKVGLWRFCIEDVVVNGYVRHTESYAIYRYGEEETHNPIGHYFGSRQHCWTELKRLARLYHCQPGDRCACHLHSNTMCEQAIAFLNVELPEGVLYPVGVSP